MHPGCNFSLSFCSKPSPKSPDPFPNNLCSPSTAQTYPSASILQTNVPASLGRGGVFSYMQTSGEAQDGLKEMEIQPRGPWASPSQ